MRYSYSDIDNRNLKWFANDTESANLIEINLRIGQIRGLRPCVIQFHYPISAIAGENGSGKSTILAMACCAYHNADKGYIPSDRNKSYYTFSDFFVQTKDEMKPEGIDLYYRFMHNHWKGLQPGPAYQRRIKKQGGKWNAYDKRIKRNVVFLGIQRIVPPGERKTERSYSNKFKSIKLDEQTKNRILEIAGIILGKRYTTLDLRTVDKRRLFVVDRKESHYSGFNMGAGENAVFSLLIELFSAEKGCLLVIDEIELGLHESAQKRLISELKKLCWERKCQIICSTHSSTILEKLPPEGRLYIESTVSGTNVIPEISPEYAMGKLSAGEKKELTIYTEDQVGQNILEGFLPNELLRRVNMVPIGSDQAVLKQLAAAYRVHNYACLAFCDGDKRNQYETAVKQVRNHLESLVDPDFEEWINKHLRYLPGDIWPEKYLLEVLNSSVEVRRKLAERWRMGEDFDNDIVDQAILAGKHSEFYMLAQQLNLNEDQVRMDVIRAVADAVPDKILDICQSIEMILEYR